MIEGLHYQNAYITRDIDKAVEAFRSRANVQDVMTIEIEQPLRTPRGNGIAHEKLAFIWIDNLQYELIQPISGMVHVYADELPDDDSMKFHHVCMRVTDWDDFRGRVEKSRYPIALEGDSGDQLKFLYLDARDFVGHYLEYVWCTQERWQQMTPKSLW
jgi:hypothetical protein